MRYHCHVKRATYKGDGIYQAKRTSKLKLIAPASEGGEVDWEDLGSGSNRLLALRELVGSLTKQWVQWYSSSRGDEPCSSWSSGVPPNAVIGRPRAWHLHPLRPPPPSAPQAHPSLSPHASPLSLHTTSPRHPHFPRPTVSILTRDRSNT